MKYTHDRNFNIVEIDIDKMDRNDLINYASLRPIWDTREIAEIEINYCKPQWVATGTDSGYYQ